MGGSLKNDHLPFDNHISRYCKPKTLSEEKPTGASFMLRENEQHLSVNWLEHNGMPSREEQVAHIRKSINLQLAKTGKLAVLNVGSMLEYVKSNSDNSSISVLHEPLPDDESHSGVFGYSHEDDLIAAIKCLKLTQQFNSIRTSSSLQNEAYTYSIHNLTRHQLGETVKN